MAQNPFTDLDFTKIMSEYKFPGLDMDSMVTAQKKNIEVITNANKVAMDGAQAVARRQAEILRQTLDGLTKLASEMMSSSGSPQDKMAKQGDLFKSTLDTAIKNMKEIAEMVTKSNQEAFEIINKRMGEVMSEMQTTVENAKPTKTGK